MELDREEILTVLDQVEDILKREDTVLYVDSLCALIIGDIHGDLLAWRKIAEIIKDVPYPVIFLGDYVDRGEYSVEILNEIFKLKIEDPDKYILLRGNHETEEINSYYGFIWELRMKFPEDYPSLFRRYNEVFSHLSLAAVIDGGNVIALHGGIPINVNSIDDISATPKGYLNAEDPVLLQVLWNDPDDSIETYAPSPRGPGIYLFGRRIFENFMSNSDARFMVRAHTFLPQGYKYFFNNRLLSIFSPLDYVGSVVNGKIVTYCNGKFDIIDLIK